MNDANATPVIDPSRKIKHQRNTGNRRWQQRRKSSSPLVVDKVPKPDALKDRVPVVDLRSGRKIQGMKSPKAEEASDLLITKPCMIPNFANRKGRRWFVMRAPEHVKSMIAHRLQMTKHFIEMVELADFFDIPLDDIPVDFDLLHTNLITLASRPPLPDDGARILDLVAPSSPTSTSSSMSRRNSSSSSGSSSTSPGLTTSHENTPIKIATTPRAFRNRSTSPRSAGIRSPTKPAVSRTLDGTVSETSNTSFTGVKVTPSRADLDGDWRKKSDTPRTFGSDITNRDSNSATPELSKPFGSNVTSLRGNVARRCFQSPADASKTISMPALNKDLSVSERLERLRKKRLELCGGL